MAEIPQDVSPRIKLIGCLVIWSLYLLFALFIVLTPSGDVAIKSIIAVSLLGMAAGWQFYLQWRDRLALASLVRANLPSERCSRCGGALNTWDGSFWPTGICVTGTGAEQPWLRHKIVVTCTVCSKRNEILVFSDGHLVNLEKMLGIKLDF
jgi:hypothetical protein